MDSEFHPGALSDSDHGACCAPPSESELELLMRMPGMGSMGEICDRAAADIAAGHAVLAAAGGYVCDLHGAPLRYGKPGLDNPHFVASGLAD